MKDLTYNLTATGIPSLLCDFYKTSHRIMYPKGLKQLYSTLTPRSNKHLPFVDRVVVFGVQGFVKKYLVNYFNENFFKLPEEEVVTTYSNFIKRTLGIEDKGDHIRDLHRLGYLPLHVKAIEEGYSVAIKVPVLTIENTHKDFAWLTNYFETLFNVSLWQPMVSASIARSIRMMLEDFAEKTCDTNDHVDFQAHDFSMRGMSSLESSEVSGAGHLLFFKGTDTIPSISYLEHYYPLENENTLVGTSIPATEHSVMSAYGLNELETFRHLIEDVYPEGFVSIVSDTYDFWKNIEETLPALKDVILKRNGRVVIRPDSGNPKNIVCGTDDPNATEIEKKGLVEALWDIFGGTINSKGYKVLDPHIGMIYGDGITYQKMQDILETLEEKGFASSNIVFGVGSFVYQYQTRDSLGFATKATNAIINYEEKHIYKDPKTDDGTKKSQRGRVKVTSLDTYQDGLYSKDDFSDCLLKTVFVNGKVNEDYVSSLETVRKRAMSL